MASFLVIDTNVFFAALLRPGGRTDEMLRTLLSRFTPAFSEATFYELAEKVSSHPKILARSTAEARREYLQSLQSIGEFVEPAINWTACRDPKDDKFLDVAVATRAEAILTGDLDLLALNPFRGIPIQTLNAFLRIRGLNGS